MSIHSKLYSRYIKNSHGSIYTISNTRQGILKKFKKTKVAFVCIHGGPGFPHNYMRNMFNFHLSIPIVMYDQAGCGLSASAMGPHCYTIEYYPNELETIRNRLGIDQLILYGHSWGSIVAYEYYKQYPQQVKAIIFASPCLSIPLWMADSKVLKSSLPQEFQNILSKADTQFCYSGSDYSNSVREYYRNFVFDIDSTSEEVITSTNSANAQIYSELWGINEFTICGKLKHYDVTSNLSHVSIPTLCIGGEFDECTETTLAHYVSLLPDSRFEIIKSARHLMNIDNFSDSKNVIESFVKKVL